MNTTTWIVRDMKVSHPGPAAKARNPERVYTVRGKFFSTKVDAKGNPQPVDLLTITNKNVDVSDVLDADFRLDKANGILTLPTGQRGRQPSADIAQDDILAELEAIRNANSEEAESD